MDRVATSKLLSFVLRHGPGEFGLVLDREGWIDVDVLLEALAAHGRNVTREALVDVVRTSDKQRFALTPDGARIRANQGHSIDVDLALPPSTPPEVLFHGTVERFLAAIRVEGLKKGARTHVHLSADVETAKKVGARRGKPVILRVDAKAMHEEGHAFFVSENGVWLVDAVPARFVRLP